MSLPRDRSLRALLALLLLAVLACAGCGGSEPVRRSAYAPQRAHGPSGGSGVAPSPKDAPKGTFRPYTINGRTYYPLQSGDGYAEEGVASWYGADFHGKRTSCGEFYNMYDLTAAHKILPMHTKVLVTNLENGRSLELRVNDRGPFVKERIIDLSLAAAQELGMADKGTTRVRVESLGAIPGAVNGDIPGVFYVQVGSFMLRDNAENLVRRLRSLGYASSRLEEALVGGNRFLRVQAGTFDGLREAEAALGRLSSGYPDAFIVGRD